MNWRRLRIIDVSLEPPNGHGSPAAAQTSRGRRVQPVLGLVLLEMIQAKTLQEFDQHSTELVGSTLLLLNLLQRYSILLR